MCLFVYIVTYPKGIYIGEGTLPSLFLLVRREVRRGKKIVTALLLVDLKAAFGSVNRKILGKKLEKREVSKELRRIIEIYEETKSVELIESTGKVFGLLRK